MELIENVRPVSSFKGLPTVSNYVDDDRCANRVVKPGVRYKKLTKSLRWNMEVEEKDMKKKKTKTKDKKKEKTFTFVFHICSHSFAHVSLLFPRVTFYQMEDEDEEERKGEEAISRKEEETED